VIDVAVDQLAEAVNVGVEENVVATLAAVTGTNAAVAVAADGSDAWAKLAAGVAAMVAAVGRRPSHFLAAADVWAALAGMTNQNGAPIINGVSQNLGGSWGSLFGVPVVVSPAIDAGKAFLVSDYGVKSWQNGTINVRVDEPTILGYAMGAGKSVGLSVASPKFITPVSVAAAP
jgi:HK97 family phage major capsid protein